MKNLLEAKWETDPGEAATSEYYTSLNLYPHMTLANIP
jgi:hypothetical protein